MTPPAEKAPLIPQLLELLDRSDPDAAAQLRAELAGEDAAPQRPPTALDVLRDEGWDAQGLTVSEIPNPHELPLLVGVLAGQVRDLTERVNELQGEDYPPEPAAAPAGSGPVSVPADPAAAPADVPAPAPELSDLPVPEPAPPALAPEPTPERVPPPPHPPVSGTDQTGSAE